MPASFTSVTTVSHRYYARRAKSEIRSRIADLARAAGVAVPDLPADATADQLASAAMRLHALLPED